MATAFRDQLPAVSDFLYQPLTSFFQTWEVYKLEVAKTSAITAEMRRTNTEDVQKRNTYRIAHGLQDVDAQGLGPWTAGSDGETTDAAVKVRSALRRPVGVEPGQEVEAENVEEGGDRKVGPPKGYEKGPVKRWLGIWS